MRPDEFVAQYETALATQNWSAVEPLMHKDACVTFSSGTVHRGLAAVQKAFESNFAAISCEKYKVSNIHWIRQDETHAVYLFDFAWTGILAGETASGGGRGTTVLVLEGKQWKLLTEHLGPRA